MEVHETIVWFSLVLCPIALVKPYRPQITEDISLPPIITSKTGLLFLIHMQLILEI